MFFPLWLFGEDSVHLDGVFNVCQFLNILFSCTEHILIDIVLLWVKEVMRFC